MKKQVLKTLSMTLLAPFAALMFLVFTFGGVLKTISLLMLGNVSQAEREIKRSYEFNE